MSFISVSGIDPNNCLLYLEEAAYVDESEKALKASLVLTLVMETLKATLFLLLLLHYCVSDIVTPQSAV